ncbi:hypothetical protein [Thermocrispum sp.]|jgi:hypothetical protein|uniref:Uncharacterized protein n=1 Tax=Thermocrispum agreste TaxID=37925 RepID=A0A2W4JL11_9PSEU|nr:hypothetical protein [Thermocrispum sp.]PZM98505.1 MAG: hypothetical protein DIU77_07795 [Thermocrispum agreste]
MSTAGADKADTAAAGNPAGTLGHELKLLVEMVLERSAPWLERLRAGDHPDLGEHSAERQCVSWCPICTAVSIAKSQGPEFSARACEQAAQAVSLLRAVLADRWHPEQGVHMPGFDPRTSGNGSAASSASAPPPAAGTPRTPAADGEGGGGQRRSSSRVQRVAVRKSENGERLR